MKVPDCPKNLKSCNQYCPEYPCWAYEKFSSENVKKNKKLEKGWE